MRKAAALRKLKFLVALLPILWSKISCRACCFQCFVIIFCQQYVICRTSVRAGAGAFAPSDLLPVISVSACLRAEVCTNLINAHSHFKESALPKIIPHLYLKLTNIEIGVWGSSSACFIEKWVHINFFVWGQLPANFVSSFLHRWAHIFVNPKLLRTPFLFFKT